MNYRTGSHADCDGSAAYGRARRTGLALCVGFALFVAACVPAYKRPPGGTSSGSGGVSFAQVATVSADAPGVYKNGNAVIGTAPLFLGDDVSTDSTGIATISFRAGGSLTIGPNTDPELQAVSDAGCVGSMLVEVLLKHGTFDFSKVTRVCFCDLQNMTCGAPSSDFNVNIDHNGLTLMVTHGRVRLAAGRHREYRYQIESGQYIVVQGGNTPGPRTIASTRPRRSTPVTSVGPIVGTPKSSVGTPAPRPIERTPISSPTPRPLIRRPVPRHPIPSPTSTPWIG